jgi:chorismate mutase
MERIVEYRNLVDDIDKQIVDLLDKRLSITKQMIKELNSKTSILNLKREDEIVTTLSNRDYENMSSQYISWLYGVVFQITKEEMRRG